MNRKGRKAEKLFLHIIVHISVFKEGRHFQSPLLELKPVFSQQKMSEKLCLQWNDFQDNIKSAFQNLREDNNFTDVTLACEDGQQVEAHKVILAASSPFFQKLLCKNNHPHPLIYMRGVKSDDLVAIVDFLYLGEANVFQDDLDSLLAIAEELQLKGLVGKTDEKVDDYIADRKPLLPTPEPAINTLSKISTNPAFSGQKKNYQSHKRAEESKVLALPTYLSGDLEELEERVKSMMEKSQNKLPDGRKADVCKVCGKEDKTTNIKDHIEANHLEGIAIPCNLCNKTFRSRNGLRRHKCFDG